MRYLSFVLALLLVLTPLTVAAAEPAEMAEVFVVLAGGGLAETMSALDGLDGFLASPEGEAWRAAAESALEAAAAQVEALGGEVLGQSWFLSRSLGVRIAEDRIAALGALPGVVSVERIGSHLAPREDNGETLSTLAAVEPIYAPDLLGLDGLHIGGTTGEGVTVAVIDNGFDVDHPVFTMPASVMTAPLDRELLAERLLLTGIGARDRTFDLDAIYHSEKIPFVYDYYDYDTDVAGQGAHGTHVASILGGGPDADGNLVGVAPGVQLLLMKAFADDGDAKASDYAIYRAIEDAILLGADVISLSLGVTAGYAYATNTFSVYRHLERARELGCLVVCAVGNDGGGVGRGSAYDESREIDFPLAANPDYGLVSEPASYTSSLAVGAYTPDRAIERGLGTLSGNVFAYLDSAEGQGFTDMVFTEVLRGQTLEYVAVPGLGEPADYAGLDLTGKLALVERGVISFHDKLQAAYAAGAVGMVCYNNEPDDELINMAFEAMPIPAIMISRAEGEAMLAAVPAERAIVVDPNRMRPITLEGAGQPAEYTTVSSGLAIRPSVIAPGSIFAAIPDGEYRLASGTSMATPTVAGLCALALSADDAETAADLDALSAALITTATPLTDEAGHPYSVRLQGGGAIDAAAFLAGGSALRAADGRGLIELGDDLPRSGAFTLTATLTNPSTAARSYQITASVGSDDYFLLDEEGIITAFAADRMRVFANAEITLDGYPCNRYAESEQAYILTLAPGETREFSISVTLSPEEVEEYGRYFANGHYLEGYIYVESDRREQLSLPYLGFAGDFDALPHLDTFDYDGERSFFGANHLVAAADGTMLNLGCNLFADEGEYLRDLIAFSPNGDGRLDHVQLGLNLLRNLYSYEVVITDADGETVKTSRRLYYLSKAYYGPEETLTTMLTDIWDGSDDTMPDYILPDGRYTATLRVYAVGETVAEEVSLPLVIDTKPVELTEWSVVEAGGRRYLYASLRDEHYPMRAVLYCDETDAYGRVVSLYRDVHDVAYVEGRRELTLAYNITDFAGDHLYLELYDYALNRTTLRLPLGN